MDVLRPALINIDGRVYRRNMIKEEQYEEEEEYSYSGPPGKLQQLLTSCLVRICLARMTN